MKDINRKFDIFRVNFCYGLLALCSACSVKHEASLPTAFHSQGDAKLRAKAALLQKKLETAQRTLSEDEQTIERLRVQLCEAELKAIESKVASFESQWRSNPQRLIQSVRPEFSKLFLEERETLSRIIHGGIDAQRAQALLDRVLQLITQLSDSVPLSTHVQAS